MQRALKIALVLIGLIFVAMSYPLLQFLLHPDRNQTDVPMMLSLYVTLGVFALLAVRNPAAYRPLIAFTAWSSFAHAAVMTVQSFQYPNERFHLFIGVALFSVIGTVLMILGPARSSDGALSPAAQK
jgi:hypothetical protein